MYLPKDDNPSQYQPNSTWSDFVHATNCATYCYTCVVSEFALRPVCTQMSTVCLLPVSHSGQLSHLPSVEWEGTTRQDSAVCESQRCVCVCVCALLFS